MSHAKNAYGIGVGCSGCHVAKAFLPKMMQEARSITEVYHHLVGTIDTREKF